MLARDPWEDPDEFREVIESLGNRELGRMLERLNAAVAATDDTPALSARALLHRALGDLRRADEDYDRVIQLSPGDSEAHKDRGLVRAALGEHGPAVEDYGARHRARAAEQLRAHPDGTRQAQFLRDRRRAVGPLHRPGPGPG